MSDKVFVLTGGLGAGKTSLIKDPARSGLHRIPVSGRAIIRKAAANGGRALTWVDRRPNAESGCWNGTSALTEWHWLSQHR